MKLISCHIENYGKITDTDFKFDKDLTSFCESNGYGKTTLASFLKAMFYGLETDRANVGFNERRHFNPFGGGHFGGYVTFESDGSTYKIERYFDEKSETRDTVTLYVNGEKKPARDNLGESLFGIDRPSFERTIFISAEEIEISSTGSINTKLNNFIEGSNDDTNLEAALNKLEAKSKVYKKSRQGNDLITRENQNVLRLTEQITNMEAISATLPEKYARLDEIGLRITELTEEISISQNVNVELNNWANYDRMSDEIADTEQKIKDIKSRYPRGVPSPQEISETTDAINRDAALKAGAEQKLFTDDDETKFAALHLRFDNNLPSEEQLAKTEKDMEEYAALSYDIEALDKTETAPKTERLKQRFVHHVPSNEELAELDEKSEKYKKAEAVYSEMPDYIADSSGPISSKKQSITLYIAIAIISAVVFVAGIPTVIAFSTLIGGILLGVGGVGILVAGFLYLNKKVSSTGSGQGLSNPDKLAARKNLEALSNEIQAFLMPYGYTLSEGVAYSVAMFKDDVQSYRELMKIDEDNKRKREDKLNTLQKVHDEIAAFFALYDVGGDSFSRRLSNLRLDLNNYRSLKSRKAVSVQNEMGLQEKIAENRKTLVAFCKKYRFDLELIADKIKIIEDDCNELDFAKKTLSEKREKAELFKKEKHLTERPGGQAVDLKELNERLAELQDKKNALLSEVTGEEYEVEKLDELRVDLENAKEKTAKYKRTYEILRQTIDALNQADKRLKDKYVKPIKDKFVYYTSVLEKTLGEKITMGVDFDIRYERNGKERSEKHLSSGQRSICALCFRLALIDNMYSEEKPFLILDDPFVNLDPEHMEKVRIMLKDLSKRLQMIYFTCHPSREVK